MTLLWNCHQLPGRFCGCCFKVCLKHYCFPERGFEAWALPTPPSATEPCSEPLTSQHGDEGKAVVLGAAPVAGFSEHVSVENLVVKLLDPGLGEDHQHPAGLHLLHELFLQRRSHEKVTKYDPLQTNRLSCSSAASSRPESPSHRLWEKHNLVDWGTEGGEGSGNCNGKVPNFMKVLSFM